MTRFRGEYFRILLRLRSCANTSGHSHWNASDRGITGAVADLSLLLCCSWFKFEHLTGLPAARAAGGHRRPKQ